MAEQVLTAVPELALALVPPLHVAAQGLDGDRIERKRPAAIVRLPVGVLGLSCDHHAGITGGESRVVQVQVAPPQPGQLAAAQTGSADQQPERGVLVRPGVLDERT